jgi:transcriptional regulator with XRE-family HTH domain
MEEKTERGMFGKQLRLLREKKHLSQEDAAALAGVHRNYWGSCERAERNISLHNILKFARALGVHPSRLFANFPKAASTVRKGR